VVAVPSSEPDPLDDRERERERLGSAAAADLRGRFASARQLKSIQSLYAAVEAAGSTVA